MANREDIAKLMASRKAATPARTSTAPKGLDYYKSKLYDADDIKGRVIAIYANEGVGKTVLAAKLGTSNLFITDDNGILSLKNHPELDAISFALPFEGYSSIIEILGYVESGEFINPKTGTPFDNIVFDTISGMCSTEIHESIVSGAIKAEGGKLADNIPTRPHYLLNEQNLGPLMKECAKLMNASVTMLSHLRERSIEIPGSVSRADLHSAAYKLVAKYSSIVAFMEPGASEGSRTLRVMPTKVTAAKTRLNFGKAVMTDGEFVSAVEKWKPTS